MRQTPGDRTAPLPAGTGLPPDELLARIAQRLKALADPTRLSILHALRDGEICVGDVAGAVGGGQANVSKHLGVLRQAGLVRARRDGMNVCYSVADPAVFEVCRLVCDGIGRELGRAIEEVGGGTGTLGARPAYAPHVNDPNTNDSTREEAR